MPQVPTLGVDDVARFFFAILAIAAGFVWARSYHENKGLNQIIGILIAVFGCLIAWWPW